ncbi:ESAT-6-like protein [Streptomyces ruber]|uniref:ESAT-6-like protein n=2 Tax=Streptomyces TaxID=1883 RepID=A0A918EPT9_9ACTN|nr:WXG100 family type VII secretion target [Streptomyces ruber]GGQ44504.1 ESAT-6-like protein [Streptomyces ruber]
MADGIIDIQYSVVRNAIEEMQGQTQQIRSTLNRLEDELRPLIASWEGDDQTMYRSVQAEWNAATQRMGQLLAETSALVGDIHDGHARDERRSADNWGAVRAR